MLFNSISFALFLPVVFFLYWFAAGKKLKYQNALLLISSYFFYGSWDYRFLLLLIFSTFLDYYTGIKIHESVNKRSRKFWLWLSITINVGFLAVFKYFNFFSTSLAQSLNLLGIQADFWTLNVILPVGISFYTFHGMSYVIDLYYDRIKPERNFIIYSLFVSYFPLLVAGPIERATHLLPQLKVKRAFSYPGAVDGLRQILWGLFKKIVIADNLGTYVNMIFENPSSYSGSTLALGAVMFTIQIYCDFSGYSDIALGTSRLFGINLLRNFAFPFFSRSISEFWRRWHISLSSWFRDYLYIPLGGSKVGSGLKIMNFFIIFLVSGFWHGANWTFIAWGALNAIYIMPSVLFKTNRQHLGIVAEGKLFPTLREAAGMAITFMLTVFAFIFFRAEGMSRALYIVRHIFSRSLLSIPDFPGIADAIPVFLITIGFFIVEWLGRHQQYAIADLGLKWKRPLRWAFYYCIVWMIYYFAGREQQFIYFQF